MSHYLVTGCAGFIGSHVSRLLVEHGHTVIGIDNLNDAYDVRLKQWRLEALRAEPRFQFAEVDISARGWFQRLADPSLFAGVAAVINLAAQAGVRPSVDNPWIYYETNVTGTLNLLDFCIRHEVGKFVLASSSSLYGSHNPRPFHEDAHTSFPVSPYAASKKAAEELCYSYHHLHGVDVSVLRFFTVYGPAGRPDMSPFRFIQWISEGTPVTVYGDGHQERDFTYVTDIAAGVVAALRPLGYDIINLGSDQPVELRDFIAMIETATGRQAQLQYQPGHVADVPATWADITKAAKVLDWHPRMSVREGVERTVAWYQENRDWARQIRT